MPGCEILEQNIQVAHIHLLMVIPPKYAVSEVIGQMKQYTASRLRKKFAWLEKVYWKEQVVWSPGYFVSTVRLDEKQITDISISVCLSTNILTCLAHYLVNKWIHLNLCV